MLNPLAEQLIHDLRHDDHTREHFSIRGWEGKGTCGTVGCIAGTALYRAGIVKPSYVGDDTYSDDPFYDVDMVGRSQNILGIEFRETAADLFLPVKWKLKAMERDDGFHIFEDGGPRLDFSYLPTQARPSPDYIAEWKEWAETFNADVTPDQAARALELVTEGELPFCDWKRAVEEA